MITQERLKELLIFNDDSGVFTRKVTTSPRSLKSSIAGSLNNDGYIRVRVDCIRYQAHRLVWLYARGIWPDKIDHINGDRSDNRLVNLRSVTHEQNQKNRKIGKNNKSGMIGVRFNKKINKWMSKIKSNRKEIHLGSFDDKFEAACARKSAEIKYEFHENHGRNK